MFTSSRHRIACGFVAGLLLAPACKKGSDGSSDPSSAASQDHHMDQEGVPWVLVDKFQHDDRAGLLAVALDDLSEDLSAIAFEDIAKVLKWLGPLEEVIEDEVDEQPAGSHYTYELHFQKGVVHLAVTMLPGGELVNFHFEGEDFIAAEHGALDDGYSKFKVYDFKWVDELGNKNPKENHVKAGRIDYRIVVGGLEAELGEHHLTFEKIVTDRTGGELIHEPIEFDRQFEENAEGIPRARLHMFVNLPDVEPGEYDLTLKITDNLSGSELEHKEHFIVE